MRKRLRHYRKRGRYRKRITLGRILSKLEKNPSSLNEREMRMLLKFIKRFNTIWYFKTILNYYSKHRENKGYG